MRTVGEIIEVANQRAGAQAERAAIVAWLRDLAGKELSSVEWLQQARSEFAGIIASSVERGDHISGGEA